MSSQSISIEPFKDQKPGTVSESQSLSSVAKNSGLRKKVKVFQQANYSESFITSILLSIPEGVSGSTLVIGGDGRYWNTEVTQLIIKISAAYGVKKLIIGQNGILSTPAASHVIRIRKATGGILLTASHNPGGPNEDFGIKYNLASGAPAPESVTNKIFEKSQSLQEYKINTDIPNVDLSKLDSQTVTGGLKVEIIHPTSDYVDMLKSIFDFDLIRSYTKANPDFKILFDALSGVTGPYAVAIFQHELGLSPESTQNCEPKPNFGGHHPDPNLVYAQSLVKAVEASAIPFGAASDGDGDRNMIYGAGAFVSPGDSLAIIAHHAAAGAIPYFRRNGVKGLARSMPTSAAIDHVAKKLGVPVYEVPTGWKFFCGLFDAGKMNICGEESFGTGSDHIREKDGLWAVLAWLNIIAAVGTERKEGGGSGSGSNAATPPSIKSIQHDFWNIYGRTFFTRFDYENCDAAAAGKVVEHMRSLITEKRAEFIASTVTATVNDKNNDKAATSTDSSTVSLKITDADDFSYTDLDGSVSSSQGIFVRFDDGSRIVVRLSGTGSSGATIRLYVEKHEGDASRFDEDAQDYLRGNVAVAMAVLRLEEFIGRVEPDVKT